MGKRSIKITKFPLEERKSSLKKIKKMIIKILQK